MSQIRRMASAVLGTAVVLGASQVAMAHPGHPGHEVGFEAPIVQIVIFVSAFHVVGAGLLVLRSYMRRSKRR